MLRRQWRPGDPDSPGDGVEETVVSRTQLCTGGCGVPEKVVSSRLWGPGDGGAQ